MAIITASNTTYAAVAGAVAMASRGDTVVVPPGSSTWSSSVTLSLTKGINLIGSGAGNTIITSSNEIIDIRPDLTAIANEETIRIEGFTFDGNNFALSIITGKGATQTAPKAFKNVAIGNNTFRNMSNTTAGSGVIYTTGQFRGVIFNNLFSRCNVILKIMGNDEPEDWNSGNFPFAYGNEDNFFFEDNRIEWPTSWTGGDPGWTETGQGARLVMRYNTWDMSHASGTELWDIHGFQNWSGGATVGQTGTMVIEYYGNTLTSTSGYRWVNLRGSWGLIFNNIMTGGNGGSIGINEFGCTEEIPAGIGVGNVAEVNNSYIFNNTVNGVIHNMVIEQPRCDIAENVSFWNYNPTFGNGEDGIGRGTSAPVTTGNGEGSGYWVASTATPLTSADVIQAGHLYKVVAGEWVDYYTPYTYPHPLRTENPAPVVETGPVVIAGVPVF